MQMESLHQDETIVALATAYGVGAVGMVRLSGKASIAIANKVFRGPDLSAVQSHTVHYGHIHNKDKVIFLLFFNRNIYLSFFNNLQ